MSTVRHIPLGPANPQRNKLSAETSSTSSYWIYNQKVCTNTLLLSPRSALVTNPVYLTINLQFKHYALLPM